MILKVVSHVVIIVKTITIIGTKIFTDTNLYAKKIGEKYQNNELHLKSNVLRIFVNIIIFKFKYYNK